MSGTRRVTTILIALAGALSPCACRREARTFRPSPASAEPLRWTSLSELHPGPAPPMGRPGAMVAPAGHVANGYEENAYAVSEGKRLFSAFNCTGCHAHGGGDIGPPLLDDRWIYGAEPEQVFSTIVEGRPNGMPSFGPRIPAYEIWWLTAYVRSLSGLVNKNAAPGRDDHMKSNPPENSKPAEAPKNSSMPKSAERPE